jgi:hypothetical protein
MFVIGIMKFTCDQGKNAFAIFLCNYLKESNRQGIVTSLKQSFQNIPLFIMFDDRAAQHGQQSAIFIQDFIE